ncbi:peptide deformylase [Oerskovia flava]|uniref:peptide deformylase n=1 Tax=Oerskovia flava TaxID=2986422 RepID=UPI00223F12B6|nr:peptide deformylase [Oerskovia sp. JB1-3-2]
MWSFRRRRPVTYLLGAPVESYPDVPPEVGRGQVRRITEVGEDVLHQPCRPVAELGTPELAALVDDLFATMDNAEGVGLAANQIGVGLRVFVYDVEDEDGDRHVGHVVNPVLEITSDPEDPEEQDEDDEGCLSVPGAYAPLSRAWSARVRGVDQYGDELLLEADGYLARAFQHEAQHLDGRLYIDLLTERARRDVLTEMREERPAILEGRRERAVAQGREPAEYPERPRV